VKNFVEELVNIGTIKEKKLINTISQLFIE